MKVASFTNFLNLDIKLTIFSKYLESHLYVDL